MIDEVAVRTALLQRFPHVEPGRFTVEEFEQGDQIGATYRDGVKVHSCRVDVRNRDEADVFTELERAVASWWPEVLAEYNLAQGGPGRRYVAEPEAPKAKAKPSGPASLLNGDALEPPNRYLAVEIATDGSIVRVSVAGQLDADGAESLKAAMADVKFAPLEPSSDDADETAELAAENDALEAEIAANRAPAIPAAKPAVPRKAKTARKPGRPRKAG